MKIVDKMGVPIEEGAILYRLEDNLKYRVTRITSTVITYELSTMLPKPIPGDEDKVMVAENFLRLYDPPQKARTA